MSLRAIILGCGSSAGVPRLGGKNGEGDWGACDPENPKNRRRRCSILIQRADDDLGWNVPAFTSLLIDTSPDLRMQLLDAKIGRLDAVAWTHDHADQCHGIDDLRALVLNQRRRMPVWLSDVTSPVLKDRFSYCFEDNPKTGYPAILDDHPLTPAEPVEIGGPTGNIELLPILMEHGPVPSLAFRMGGMGEDSIVYSPDISGVPEASWPMVTGCGIWICDALRYKPHPSHVHLEETLSWLTRAGAGRGVLTNLHIDMDYETLERETPTHVAPAFDGMVIETGR
ncbi:MBL fold metallo-hydrolase [Parvularcula marina]|uniref:MBL fold metallo-hydrolase n=1 Tax=Parvularcula marina TaxID=2292771 RepID=UPI00351891D7